MYQYLLTSLSKRISIVLIFVGCCIAASDVKGQNPTTAQLDNVISDLQSLLQIAGPQAQLSENTQDLQQIYELFRYKPGEGWDVIPESDILEAQKQHHRQDKGLSIEAGYLENFDQGVFSTDGIYYDRRFQMGLSWDLIKNGWLDNAGDAKTLATEQEILRIRQKQMLYGPHYSNLTTTIDFIINLQKTTHLKNYLAALSVQQNQLLTLYDMGYKPWQEVRDVMGKQAAMEMKLQTISKQQQLIQKDRVLPELYSNLPVLAVNIDPIESALESNAANARYNLLKRHVAEYQALLEEYSSQNQQHLMQTDQVYVAGAGDQIEYNGEGPASKLSRVLDQFEIKGKLIEVKRNLYHKLIQISSLVPELPIANFTEIYDSGKLIKETNRVRGLTYEE